MLFSILGIGSEVSENLSVDQSTNQEPAKRYLGARPDIFPDLSEVLSLNSEDKIRI